MRRLLAFSVLLVAGVSACAGTDDAGVAAPTTSAPSTTPTTPTSGVSSTTVGSSDPTTNSTTNSTSNSISNSTIDRPGVRPGGFELVAATVTEADGDMCELCVWLADTPDLRRHGLMAVTDLGPADGMVFSYPQPRTGTFHMTDTLLPLTIAFFDERGTYLAAFDMEPCDAEPCPNYATPTDFSTAIEVPQGALADLGIGAGSSIQVSALPCGS